MRSFKLIVTFLPITSTKKTDCPLLQKEVKRTRKTVTLEVKMLVIRKRKLARNEEILVVSSAWHRLLYQQLLRTLEK